MDALVGLGLSGFVLYLSAFYVDDVKGVHLNLSKLLATAGNLKSDRTIVARINER